MKFYIIRHKPSGKTCYKNTPYGEPCFACDSVPPKLYKTPGQAKSAISRGINNAREGVKDGPDSEYNDWLQFLIDTEVIELALNLSGGTVVYRAIQQMGKK